MRSVINTTDCGSCIAPTINSPTLLAGTIDMQGLLGPCPESWILLFKSWTARTRRIQQHGILLPPILLQCHSDVLEQPAAHDT